jgi:hypothetical protein
MALQPPTPTRGDRLHLPDHPLYQRPRPRRDPTPNAPNCLNRLTRDNDYDKHRRLLWARGVKPLIARRGANHGSGLGKVRWVVERTFAWLHSFRRLRTRCERSAPTQRIPHARRRHHLPTPPALVPGSPLRVLGQPLRRSSRASTNAVRRFCSVRQSTPIRATRRPRARRCSRGRMDLRGAVGSGSSARVTKHVDRIERRELHALIGGQCHARMVQVAADERHLGYALVAVAHPGGYLCGAQPVQSDRGGRSASSRCRRRFP